MIILVGLNSRIDVYFIMLKEEELFSKILYLDILLLIYYVTCVLVFELMKMMEVGKTC